VTRDLQWGVRVPLKGFEEKVIYVWFDAVLGYISSTQEWARSAGTPERWKEYWRDPGTKYVAFIGKDNVVFHCIVFPAMLMAWNDHAKERYVLPENVPANEFLNFQGQKFSKSRGWGIYLDEFLEAFPADALRYTLTMNLPETRDADFTWKDFQARTNNELADILGNFVNRTLTFVHRQFGGTVPAHGELGPADRALIDEIAKTERRAADAYEQYKFRDGTLEVMNLARAANKYFNDAEPWKTQASDPPRCAAALYVCCTAIRALAILIEPVLPSAAGKMWRMLNLAGSACDAGWDHAHDSALQSGHAIGAPEILFTKIEDDVIQQQIDRLGAPEEPAVPPPAKPRISIDDFRKIDLRTATVLKAERVPKSQKLLKLLVSLGSEERQIIAGIGQHYQPEELVGKSVVVVANLAPAKLMGEESQGMLLAATEDGGTLSIVTTAVTLAPGSGIK
jgi:methionyl-tRNA synthetase